MNKYYYYMVINSSKNALTNLILYFPDYGHTSPFPHLSKPTLEAPHTHWRPQGKKISLFIYLL